MIVECESCRTRFRLDDARVPATGAKVRCSRCKTAFIVHRPKATPDEVIEEVVAEATNPGATRSPDVTQDLFDVSATSATAAPRPAASDDEKWEFDEEPQSRPAPPAAAPRVSAPLARAEKPAAPAPLDEEDLDSLGSPSEWNFLGAGGSTAGEAGPRPEPPREEARRAPAAAPAAEDSSAPLVDASLARVIEAQVERPPAVSGARERVHAAMARVISGAAWLAASALCAAGLGLALTPRTLESAPAVQEMHATLDGAQHAVAVRELESAIAGKLVVVRGELPARALRSSGQRLRAAWVDGTGAPLASASALASSPREAHALRESSLESLQAGAAAFTGGAFELVFETLPDGAAGISFRREAVPQPAPAATQEEAATQPAEGATTSSRPSLPLSSE